LSPAITRNTFLAITQKPIYKHRINPIMQEKTCYDLAKGGVEIIYAK